MGIEADQAKQLRDVDYALAHLSALGAQVTFKPGDDHSTYGHRAPLAVIRIKNSEETVERVTDADGNNNIQWLIEIGHKAFEMHIDLSNRGA
jgi:hypothetical protein